MRSDTLAIVVKGFPRLSETFVSRELAALECRGIFFNLFSLRKPYSDASMSEHAVVAPVRYIPEYLSEAPVQTLSAVCRAVALPGFALAFTSFLKDLRRDFSSARVRRFGQACILVQLLPTSVQHIHAHFAHSPTPGNSVTFFRLVFLPPPQTIKLSFRWQT